MITKFITPPILSIILALWIFASCSKNNNSEQLSSQESVQPSSSAQESTPTGQSEAKKKSAQTGRDTVEIKEKMFIAQTNDIYINKNDYLGKTIKYEGLFDQSTWRNNGKTYHFVVRMGPGCCPGDAAAAGFEVVWDKAYPKKNDWVEVAGVLEEYDDDGIPSLRLAVTSLKVLTKRGKEKVAQ